MKKLVLFFAVACAVSFAACSNKSAEATEETVDTVAVEAVVEEQTVAECTCDSCACDTCKCAAEAAANTEEAAVVVE